MIDVRRVQGRREFSRFIDYAYDRNRSDPHWVPPLRMAERERLTPRKNPFFAHADVELFLAWRGESHRRPHRRDRRPSAQRTPRRQHRDVRVFRSRGRRRHTGAAGNGGGVGEGPRPGGDARTDQSIAQRERGPAHRRLRQRPDADDAAQPAGVCGVPRGRRLSQGEGSVRLALRRRGRAAARHRQACAAPARARRDRRAAAAPVGVHARSRAAAHDLLRRLGAELGLRRRRRRPSSAGSPAS